MEGKRFLSGMFAKTVRRRIPPFFVALRRFKIWEYGVRGRFWPSEPFLACLEIWPYSRISVITGPDALGITLPLAFSLPQVLGQENVCQP